MSTATIRWRAMGVPRTNDRPRALPETAETSLREAMTLQWHNAAVVDLDLLSLWNAQLIHDEGHRNAMTVEQLADRMANWLSKDYRAIIFSDTEPVAYALFELFELEEDRVHLRQFFVRRDRRRVGVGRRAFELLRTEIWPRDVRSTVDVLCKNSDGVAFWRSLGYRDYCLTLEMMSS